ncbi:MAG: hypothetical protein WAL66_00060 [Nitrososphaeraceae archaeon]
MKTLHLPYRQAEGVVMVHASTKVPCTPDYSTISRRVNKQTRYQVNRFKLSPVGAAARAVPT